MNAQSIQHFMTMAVLVMYLCNSVGGFKAIQPSENDGISKKVEDAKKDGWKYLNSTRKLYQTFIEHVSQKEAKDRCKAKGATLANIHSQEENDLLLKDAKELPNSHGINYDTNVWIGLERTGNTFTWSDGSKLDYSNWGQSEPNFYQQREFCVVFNQYTDMNGHFPTGSWNDWFCENKVRGYVCEMFAVEYHRVSA
ncbi:hypothetical protein Q1695_009080 [Nippostrongylus brasiliensis]|nr:hypothetical protein Q1695_009080 [Nippostrongylus brasiliensis]